MKKQVVAPRLPTPGTPSGGSSSARMPDDVLADQVSRLKLIALVLDFGLVQTRKSDPAAAITETLATAQTLIGTPAYMAPERSMNWC